MAIIPNGEKVLMTSANVNTTYGGSAALKELNKWYTIEDIAETIGGGGGGLGDFVIEANGTMGNPFIVTYSLAAPVSGVTTGINVFPIQVLGSINLSYMAGYGYTFTATDASFTGVTNMSSINISSVPLQTISFPDLVSLGGGMAYFSIQYNQFLTTLELPLLETTEAISLSQNPLLTNLDFSSLKTVNSVISLESTPILQVDSSVFPVLETVRSIVTNVTTSIDLPSIKTFGYLQDNGNSQLTSLNLPNTVHLNYYAFPYSQHPNLTSVVLGTIGTLKRANTGTDSTVYGYSIDFSSCSLDVASVNGILTLMASLDGTNGAITLLSGSINVAGGNNAAPTGAGMTAMTTLQSRGWIISVN